MNLDKNMLEIFGGIFESQQAAEEFMKIVDGKPKRFMEELLSQMREKKTDGYYIFRIENVYPYK